MVVNVESPSHPGRARRIGGSLLWSQLGRIADVGLSLAFSVLVVRVLGPLDYATYAVVWSVISVASLVASLGYGEALARYLPQRYLTDGGAAAALARRLLGERTLLSLAAAVVVWLAVAPIAAWTHTPSLRPVIGLVAALIVGQGLWDLLAAYFVSVLRMRDHAVIRGIGQLVSVGLALGLFARLGISVWAPLAAVLASYLTSSLLYAWSARQTLTAPGRPVDLAAARRFGGYVWLTNLATFGLASQIDVLLIAALLTDATQISFYNVAALLLGRLYVILTGWGAVVLPAASEAYSREGDAGLARSFNLYTKVNLLALLPAFAFVIAWSRPLIVAFFDTGFAPAAPLLALFALFGMASALLGANVCHPLLYVANRQRALLFLRIAAGALNVVLDLLLIPPLGAAGAVIGTSISNLATHLAEFILLRRTVGAPYPVTVAGKVLIASLLAALPALLLPHDSWLSLITGGLTFAAIFALAAWRLRPLSAEDFAVVANTMPRLRPFLRWLALSGGSQ